MTDPRTSAPVLQPNSTGASTIVADRVASQRERNLRLLEQLGLLLVPEDESDQTFRSARPYGGDK